MKRVRWLAMPWLLLVTLAWGQTSTSPEEAITNALHQTRRDIETATRALDELRRAQAAERVPLAAQLADLRQEVAGLRQQAERLQQAGQQDHKQEDVLRESIDAATESCRFMQVLLSEYRRSVEARLTRPETLYLADRLKAIDQALAEDSDAAQLPQAAELCLSLAAEWNADKVGGITFAGAALDGQGIEHAGRFAVCGPATYFASTDGEIVGLAVARLGSAAVSVHETLPEADKAGIGRLAKGEEATVAVDVSGGDVLKVEAAKPSWLEHLKQGGAVMVPLGIIAIWALLLAVVKALQLRGMGMPSTVALDGVLAAVQAGKTDDAKQMAEGFGTPLGPVILEAIAHRGAPKEYVEEILHERILTYVPVLEKHLGTLAVFGGVAPLLGLLGTVTGMIHTFQLVTVFGTGDAKLLSGGISEALVTTEFGLIIAVPVLMVHAYLSRRVRTLIAGLEQAAVSFVNQVEGHKPS